ncbi:MAG TPA: sigma-70 family RNA polymerase sigma factor [Xanthobacteraceae bacterium]|nr:sigma-70 family RNA polymerase sigma factor [Xanthobacteraceae bacterium]
MQYQETLSAAPARPAHANVTTDDTLVAAVAKGDKDAMRVLFARHRVRVFRFLLRIVNSEDTAQDLLNEVFLDVWRGAARFEARSQVTTWILGIARFKGLSALRRRSFDTLDDAMAEAIEEPGDNPEAVMQKLDRSAVLQACLRQLSAAHRQVIDLVYYHEQSIEEIARIIGVPENTVKTRVFHARKRIAELMAARGIERAAL